LNILKALLARKKQFKGPKSYLKYLEGTKDRVVEKLGVHSDGPEGKSTKSLERNPIKKAV
jgi:hypothetical protein